MSDETSKPPLVLQPGILVSCPTYIRGGVRYYSEELDGAEKGKVIADVGAVLPVEGASTVARKSVVVTADAEEHERATKVRNAGRAKIAAQCALTPFGLLCPKSKEGDLDRAISEAEAAVRAFNASANYTRVDIFAVKGYIADNDEKAARGIANEIAGLCEAMKNGIEARDSDAIRGAMRKAKALQTMIDESARERVGKALEAARFAAKEITETIKLRGDANLILVADGNKKILDEMRASFTVLDLEPIAVMASGDSLAPVAAVDLDIAAPVPVPVQAPSTDIDFPELPDDYDAGAAPIIEKRGPEEFHDVDARAAVDADVAD